MHPLLMLTWFFLGLIWYIYIGYPLLMGIIAKIWSHPVRFANITPRVSLIICAYNEENVIHKKIENSLALNYPKELLEIIVITDGSTDKTPDIVRNYANMNNILFLHLPQRAGKSAAMNRAISHATGEILVFSDANALYDPESIRKLVRNFNDSNVGCVSGRKTVYKSKSKIYDSERSYWSYETYIKSIESQINSTVGVVGEIFSIRSELFERIPENIINDDAYMALRVLRRGFRVICEPEAFSYEVSASSTHDEILRRQRISAGRFQILFNPRELWTWNNPVILFQLISHKFLRLLLSFFMIGALLSNIAVLLVILDPPFIMYVFFGLQMGFYLIASTGFIAEHLGWNLKLFAAPYYITSSNFASLKGFMKNLNGTQSVLWEKARRCDYL
jgi:cellulose synthase/poly-beta-1,6-N-acetylglucosamine synthase-like glycosyltransferase